MDIPHLPFNRLIGLARCASPDQGQFMLPDSADYTNHLGTVHAGALFTLAESACGECLLARFKDLVEHERLIPVVRGATVKYRKPGTGAVTASAQIADHVVGETRASLARKGRALIPVSATVTDSTGAIIMTATVEWFVQLDRSNG